MSAQSASTGATLITGTSSGIGLHTAIVLARAGYSVVATVRRPESHDTLTAAARKAQVDFDIRLLDVTSDQSVAGCVADVLRDYGAIHALINNAGGGHIGTLETDSIEEIRAVCELNFFGVVRTSKAVLPHLRAGHGRLITVTSVGGVVGQPFNDAYCAAKFAVEGLMESLAPVARARGVAVSVIEPGAVRTEFVSNVGDLQARREAAGPYADLLDRYLATMNTHFGDGAQSATEVADVVLDVLRSPEPAFRYQTTPFATRFAATKLADVTGTAVQELTASWLTANH
jgi:NAD(P)-dependent dehydrogenase (short-subunit alcohol dehydrogenase family)